MVDFQYLPIQRSEDGIKYEPVFRDIVPQKIERPSWLQRPVPLFLPPLIFSRFDQPTDYHFRKDPVIPSKNVRGGRMVRYVRKLMYSIKNTLKHFNYIV